MIPFVLYRESRIYFKGEQEGDAPGGGDSNHLDGTPLLSRHIEVAISRHYTVGAGF